MDETLSSVLKNDLAPQLLEVHSDINNVHSTVKKEVDLVVERNLQAAIENRAIHAIKKYLSPTFTKSAAPKVVTYEDESDASNSKSAAEVSDMDAAVSYTHLTLPTN